MVKISDSLCTHDHYSSWHDFAVDCGWDLGWRWGKRLKIKYEAVIRQKLGAQGGVTTVLLPMTEVQNF